MNIEHKSESNALEWQAFRYVSGEMTGDEAREIETQMATDQAVREAVSRAVALGRKLATARPSPETVVALSNRSAAKQTPTRPWQGSALIWTAMATAASVAFLLGIYWGRHEAGDQQMVPPQVARSGGASAGDASAAIDANAWLQLHQMNRGESQTERSWDEWDADEPAGPEIDRGPVVPAWLVELASANRSKEKP